MFVAPAANPLYSVQNWSKTFSRKLGRPLGTRPCKLPTIERRRRQIRPRYSSSRTKTILNRATFKRTSPTDAELRRWRRWPARVPATKRNDSQPNSSLLSSPLRNLILFARRNSKRKTLKRYRYTFNRHIFARFNYENAPPIP